MSEPTRPALQVVRGDATPEELAALVVVLTAGGGPAPDVPAASLWARSGRTRVAPSAGPGAWRASGLPR